MGEKEVPIQNIWRTVTEISVTVDVCFGTVKYYILVRGTSEGDKTKVTFLLILHALRPVIILFLNDGSGFGGAGLVFFL